MSSREEKFLNEIFAGIRKKMRPEIIVQNRNKILDLIGGAIKDGNYNVGQIIKSITDNIHGNLRENVYKNPDDELLNFQIRTLEIDNDAKKLKSQWATGSNSYLLDGNPKNQQILINGTDSAQPFEIYARGEIKHDLETQTYKNNVGDASGASSTGGASNVSVNGGASVNGVENINNKLVKWTGGLSIKNLLGITKIADLQKIINPPSLYRKSYILLDSEKRYNKDNKTQFQWVYGNEMFTRDGFFNTLDRINTIVAIRLYQVRLPYFPQALSVSRRLSLLIEEYASQAFLSTPERRYHFIGEAVLDGNNPPDYIDMFIKDFGDAIFTFALPIKILETLTISFGNPNEVLTFPDGVRFILAFEITYFGFASENT